MKTGTKQIVIVGGGFAGVEAAIALRKNKYDVTLVSNRDYFFIYPISIWIPTGKIPFDKSTLSLPMLAKRHGFKLVVDELVNVKGNEQEIELNTQTLKYDYLVLAIGADKMKHKGIEHTFSICGQPKKSLAMKTRFDELIEKGEGKIAIGFGGNPKDKSGVRGGPAFEIMFNFISTLKQKNLYDKFDFTFFAPMPEPGKRMGKSGYKMLDVMLNKEGIAKRVGKKITGFDHNGIYIENDTFIESDLTMFIPASAGPAILQQSDLPLSDAGFVKTDDHSKVEGFDNIYAVGDVAAMNGPEWKAKQGHMAVVMGKNAAYNIDRAIKGGTKRKGYQKHINILCVMDTGNGAGFIYRKGPKDVFIPLPIVGHWMKKVWGWHYKLTRTLGI
ncbi:MAG: FAD-dependent oxidoreductase [Prolixibacteraceae bacterium]|jgi:sulfide:quinone oxidoreductase|nr:FAD-dependent oxidoreductase [Prolixibacteraceae bacterium]